ncbi:DUF397 domain-containing protein [Streptomyces luteolus]|uniref:DUF397 domain-containing protein n=1 Tax=Streptomyces luteolus TaxID=3043615 RepID=A0ABT6SXL7_9ACTN|nr:DUF397 domain-containing protein [Streptomyces sp. B-S-A12]MDI3419412.1 DUF397 domain-containing protein [Streptomyces sp. B-S-A12]
MNSTDNLAWFKSSYSGGGGGDCLEVAHDWHKSTYSDGGGGECLELAQSPSTTGHLIHIRDSKNPALPHLTTTPEAWSAFLTYAAH